MFGAKRRLREAQAQIEAYRQIVATQAEWLDVLRTWQAQHTAELERKAAVAHAVGTVMIALDRHAGGDMDPVLEAAVLLLKANRSELADDALIALGAELHDPLGEAVDSIFG